MSYSAPAPLRRAAAPRRRGVDWFPPCRFMTISALADGQGLSMPGQAEGNGQHGVRVTGRRDQAAVAGGLWVRSVRVRSGLVAV